MSLPRFSKQQKFWACTFWDHDHFPKWALGIPGQNVAFKSEPCTLIWLSFLAFQKAYDTILLAGSKNSARVDSTILCINQPPYPNARVHKGDTRRPKIHPPSYWRSTQTSYVAVGHHGAMVAVGHHGAMNDEWLTSGGLTIPIFGLGRSHWCIIETPVQ